MFAFVKKIDDFICQHLLFCGILILFVFLRTPNFAEPYWYGDEAIYLTLGTAMRHGERLYSEIIDHKTPIIYYLAMVPNQFDFRVLNFGSTFLTVTLFYFFAQKVIKNKNAALFATLFFMLFTTLPWFEGHIPNGELFVMCFVFIAATFFSRTNLFQRFVGESTPISLNHQLTPSLSYKLFSLKQLGLFFAAGIFFSLGILTKVPALFDLLAFLFLLWSFFIDTLLTKKSSNTWSQLASTVMAGVVCLVGVALPIIISIVYFILRGSGQAYLDYGLLYNFHYVETWVPTFSIPLLTKLFTLPVKVGLLTVLLVIITASSRLFSSRFRFIAGWFCLSLFASLLSNRPYPHYFLQTIPPLALLFGYLAQVLGEVFGKKKTAPQLQKRGEVGASVFFITLFLSVLLLLRVGVYSTSDYYFKFYKLITHQM